MELAKELSKGEDVVTKFIFFVDFFFCLKELRSSSVTNEGVNDAAHRISEKNIPYILLSSITCFFDCICIYSRSTQRKPLNSSAVPRIFLDGLPDRVEKKGSMLACINTLFIVQPDNGFKLESRRQQSYV